MEVLVIFIGLIMLIGVIICSYNLGLNNGNNENSIRNKLYVKKNFMTVSELVFYEKLKELELEYKIVPQINLATIINKVGKGYRNELFKNVDFAIFDKEYKKLLLLVELNDYTHESSIRKKRDASVKNICNDAGIKLITFYTKYPNEKEYILNRIKNELSYCANNINKKSEN